MESRKEDTTLLSDAGWLLELAFLTDIAEKLKVLNVQLHGEDKTICYMIGALKPFKRKTAGLSPTSEKEKRAVVKILESRAEAAGVLGVRKYRDWLCKLGQVFEERFNRFDTFELCMAFTANPFIEVDVSGIAEQMAELFSVTPLAMGDIIKLGRPQKTTRIIVNQH